MEIAIGSKRQVNAVLLDVLKSKKVHQSERIVIARVLLIICTHAQRVSVAIAGSVVVLPLKMRFPGQLLRSISSAKNGCAGMDGVVAIRSALQIDRTGGIKPMG